MFTSQKTSLKITSQIYESIRRNEIYDNIDLKSIYIKRKHEKTRLNAEFPKIFGVIAEKISFSR